MFIGLDMGTSGVKALLMDADQRVLASTSAPLTVSRPHDGWSEQEPADWLTAAGTALDALAAERSLLAVQGIGLSGQMHGATLLDAADVPLRPCILWNDTRSHTQAAALDKIPEFRALGGNIVFPGFTAPKLAWVSENEPALFERTAKVLLPKDYLRLWLTGEHVSEMSDAAGTAWLDVGARAWSDTLLSASGMSRDQMPALVEGSQASGTLRGELAARWGMGPVPVAGGGGDNAASAIGLGTISEGDAFASLGTSGVLFAANAAYSPKPESAVHAFCHAIPDTWHQMGVILSATDALNWYAKIAGQSAGDLTKNLGALQAPGATSFLPYLSGERTPHNDAQIRGAFTGLSHTDDVASLTRAVLEGVTFAFADCQAALTSAGGTIQNLYAVGGGSNSEYWLKALATTLGAPIHLPEDGDFGGAYGAARLGLLAATGADPAQICTKPRIARTIDPDTALAPAFAEAYARYKSLYLAIRSVS